MADGPLAGCSILILEDEFLIAMDVEQICLDSGALSTHIVHDLDQLSTELLERNRFDAAVLDLRIGRISTIPVAEQLAARGVPFIFATGLGHDEEIAARFPGVAVVPKPYSGDDLVDSLVEALQGARGSGERA